MITPDNKYTKMQTAQYDRGAGHMAKTDHAEHNSNPDYYGILLKDVTSKLDGKVALDFGSGTGRNVLNLLKSKAKFTRVDGCDISQQNVIVRKPNDLVTDLAMAGFKKVTYEIRDAHSSSHPQWIFVRGIK